MIRVLRKRVAKRRGGSPGRAAVSLLAVFLTSAILHAGGDAEGKQNQVPGSKLPSGNGLAAAYPAEAGLAADKAVIFSEDFEGDDFRKRWDSARDDDGSVLALVAPPGGDSRLGKHCLKVTATLGKNTGGGPTKWFEPVPVVFVRFYTWFDPTSDYMHHFVTLRANKSLQGKDKWSGFGGAGLRPDGDERFSTALEPWGDWGRLPAPGRWNFYSYWHEMEVSPDGKFWGNAFRPAQQPNIAKSTWICAEFMLKHNTPGQADGEQAFWIDGELRGHWKGISWRKSPTLMANALTMESYVTDTWTKNPVNIVAFDNLVIAKAYIGPSAPAKDGKKE